MRYPTLYTKGSDRQMVDTFKGYNHNLRIGEGEFFDMKNMTSDYYPVLSPRRGRGVYAELVAPSGMIEKDNLCYIDGTNFVINDYPVDMRLNSEPKQLLSMGAYVIILPDKKYINTLDLTDWGSIEASFTSATDVSFTLCNVNGELYTEAAVSETAPENPENMELWIDTSSTPHTLKQYSSTSAIWVSIATTYIKITATGIGKAFNQYDGVTISGVLAVELQDLNASTVIWEKGDDYIVVTGITDRVFTQTAIAGAVTVERTMPEMDFVTECNNRLWGCRYGIADNGQVVNEIYASKLGDFKNWNCFMGISTDSWVGSIGTDGQFTGAITHLGFPVFFKENCLHKVYISSAGAHQIQDTACRGVQKGCERSLAIVGETLFYKARSGVCAYDGALPAEVSYVLGNEVYQDAVGGANGNKYYISMKDLQGAYHLFVYDTAKNMWHKEDDLPVSAFCSCRGELYAVSGKKLITMLGSGTPEKAAVEWMAQTGEIGISSPDMKYISRLTVRMAMDIGAEVSFSAQYDFSEEWEPLFSMRGTNLRSFSIPIRPKRCDNMKLRIEGVGMVKIYSITKTIEQGSDIS